jgi:hypothetical protein
MCKLKKYHNTSNPQIDKCMCFFMEFLTNYIHKDWDKQGYYYIPEVIENEKS